MKNNSCDMDGGIESFREVTSKIRAGAQVKKYRLTAKKKERFLRKNLVLIE